jgi:PAS domain S-box-containing protein
VASIRRNSERKEAELARLDAEEGFLLRSKKTWPDDLDDQIIAANEAFCALVGFSKEELIGHDSKPFTYPDDNGITEETRQRDPGDVGRVRYVKRHPHQDGRVIAAVVSRSSARDGDGKTMYFIISERDITERWLLTAQLSHLALHDPLTGLANRASY